MLLNNTAGNPYGNFNVYRALRTVNGPYEVTSEGQTLYLQDTWTLDQLTIECRPPRREVGTLRLERRQVGRVRLGCGSASFRRL